MNSFKKDDIVLIIDGDSSVQAPYEAKGSIGIITNLTRCLGTNTVLYSVHTNTLINGFDAWSFPKKCLLRVDSLSKIEKIIYGF